MRKVVEEPLLGTEHVGAFAYEHVTLTGSWFGESRLAKQNFWELQATEPSEGLRVGWVSGLDACSMGTPGEHL